MAFFTRTILTLLGLAFALLLTLGVLCWLAVYVAFASLRWLMTGQKPQVLMMWQQLQVMRQGMQSGQGARWSRGSRGSRTSDGPWHEAQGHVKTMDAKSDTVEDVVVRDIQDKRHLPKD